MTSITITAFVQLSHPPTLIHFNAICCFSCSSLLQFPAFSDLIQKSHSCFLFCLCQTPPHWLHIDIPTSPFTFPPCAMIYLFSSLSCSTEHRNPLWHYDSLSAFCFIIIIIVICIFTSNKSSRSYSYGYCNWKEYFFTRLFVFYYCFITDRRAEGILRAAEAAYFLAGNLTRNKIAEVLQGSHEID